MVCAPVGASGILCKHNSVAFSQAKIPQNIILLTKRQNIIFKVATDSPITEISLNTVNETDHQSHQSQEWVFHLSVSAGDEIRDRQQICFLASDKTRLNAHGYKNCS